MTDNTDTIVALATPNGVGAIAVIRLSGPDAINIANSVFKGKDLSKQASHTIHFGSIADGDLILDEVLVSLFVGPRSYTRENVVEISCHASGYIIESIIKLFIKKGARSAKPGEFTLRAFLNGQLDLSQAEAVADLIASNSKASQQVALQQLRGGFSTQLQALREQLVNFASLIELELDFAEEDVEFANRDQLKQLIHEITKIVGRLINSFELGNAIKNGVNTVIAGRPNAGKSTLLNALLNEERAIVSHIPGTTRDTIEEVLNIQGINFRLIDTAGIREATDAIEQIGVQRTMEKISQSALLVYVFDAAEITIEELNNDIASLQKPGVTMLVVANKADLLNKSESQKVEKSERSFADLFANQNFDKRDPSTSATSLLQPFGLPDIIFISAKEKHHIDELKHKIYSSAVKDQLSGDETLVTNIRHLEALQKTGEALVRVLGGIDGSITSDFLSMDIKQALHYLGEITGVVTTDDLLENIFSKFCIGK
ncbi:tRNA uridine-5-carboxymethylaminomethyl(34) synthesis GTPase MnmE [Mucilaginibacter rubeus]|uniref:tRNA modification GTPase MnmE n=1 Tax=Mucilaginibacter rubeus TaxID=2027860 RepID=A0AAE6JIF7_9SPHI|nr:MULTISPECIES: tRNA uridine-5-carboxymethylaminomethyl(34) synthesis GTPase MnmE [Mucilaginibacter]QEM05327.1 tRNA uridine-5-carboxymethylaminomethyl(34) synthesis GTPase MnmE [Mucilaginibacter rubeus]QEM17917.1 tRNA uridine-5-carboxymethylaminomethyl(34) synthesis GTPase MnmE [Mucilaginibacter gossypii]QTE45550.1 tRNA uridine-5-carboxymethylaminomethyl(34) synthesis GTPase MnmE [Mucilaginibacter rubeus]QTE52147.1 tRNA uridine-5-carboxymethylaminomethyl(34) synthesis GTPase MnmE [Mucilaginiba